MVQPHDPGWLSTNPSSLVLRKPAIGSVGQLVGAYDWPV